MAEKVDVVYIGDKPVKKDTITGSRLLFPRMQPVAVESDIAYRLLRYSDVWVTAAEAGEAVAKLDAARDAAAALEAAEVEAAAARAAAESMVVGEYDLTKYTSAQLATFVEANDLGVKKGSQEPVEEYRARVRDAYRAKLEVAE